MGRDGSMLQRIGRSSNGQAFSVRGFSLLGRVSKTMRLLWARYMASFNQHKFPDDLGLNPRCADNGELPAPS